jgi:hypothetical protein
MARAQSAEPGTNESHLVSPGLSPRSRARARWKAVIGLAHGWPVKKIVAFAEVSKATLMRWQRHPEVQRAVVKERARLARQNRGTLLTVQAKALAKLAELMGSADEETALRAATTLAKLTTPPRLTAELMADDLNMAERFDAEDEDVRQLLSVEDVDEDDDEPPARP